MNHDERNFRWAVWSIIGGFLLLFLVGGSDVWGGIVDYTDDDPQQWIYFNNYDPNIDSVYVWVMIDTSIGFVNFGQRLNGFLSSSELGYIRPDRDENNYPIPGHYEGEYWYYSVAYDSNQGIMSPDTVHWFVLYDIAAPIGDNLWQFEDGRQKYTIGQAPPLTYQNVETDSSWDNVDPNWVQTSDTSWMVEKGRHKAYAYENGQIYFAIPKNDKRYVIGLKQDRLIKFDKTDSSFVTLELANHDSVTIAGQDIIYHDIYYGIDKIQEYDNAFYRESFSFSQAARDSLTAIGDWQNCMIGTVALLDIDSLRAELSDSSGTFNIDVAGRFLRGAMKVGDNGLIYALPKQYLILQDTMFTPTTIPVRKFVYKKQGDFYFVELFDAVDAGQLPPGTILHNADIGYDTIGTTSLAFVAGSNNAGYGARTIADFYTASTGDIMDSVYFYGSRSGGGSDSVWMAVYEIGFTVPDNLSDSTTVGFELPPSNTWNGWDVNWSLTNGEKYGCAFHGNATVNGRGLAATNGYTGDDNPTPFNDPWNENFTGQYRISMYGVIVGAPGVGFTGSRRRRSD